MRILIVDDEKMAMTRLHKIVGELCPEAELISFQWAEDVIAYPEKEKIDIAFLDIHLGDISGLELAMILKRSAPSCNIIFITSHEQYAVKAVQLHASGYVLKPYAPESIAFELKNLLYLNDIKPLKNRLQVRTFGVFNVFDGKERQIHFSRAASREIFAYLIDARGVPVTSADIAEDVLQTEMSTGVSKKISQYIRDLISDLAAAGFPDVVKKEWKKVSLNREAVDCDLYRLLEGDVNAINRFQNNYLEEFPWAYHQIM